MCIRDRFNTLVFVLKIASVDVAAAGLGPLPTGTSADPSALVSPARAAVLDQLTSVGGPASVAELAASSGQVYPANDWHERETWAMLGIEFDGPEPLPPILIPHDWPCHPHCKDYPLGGIPVEYKGATVPPPDQRRK